MLEGLASAIVGSILSAIVKTILGIVEKRQNDAHLKELGRAEGEAETSTVITEIADAQARNNARPRDAGDIARRLRDDADRADRGE